MILYVYIGDVADAGGVLTFYIPAIIDDGDHWIPLRCVIPNQHQLVYPFVVTQQRDGAS